MSTSGPLSFIACAAALSFCCGCSGLTEEETWTPQAQQGTPVANTLAASHILIMHEGSAMVPPDVTRTKEEAQALAVEIAAKAQAADADFAALAKESSDCPSAKEGGNLGSFPPTGVMDQVFSDATQALEIGGVSDPVETQFGYHVILRNEP